MKFQDVPVGAYFQFEEVNPDGAVYQKISNNSDGANNVLAACRNSVWDASELGSGGNADPDWECAVVPKPPAQPKKADFCQGCADGVSVSGTTGWMSRRQR